MALRFIAASDLPGAIAAVGASSGGGSSRSRSTCSARRCCRRPRPSGTRGNTSTLIEGLTDAAANVAGGRRRSTATTAAPIPRVNVSVKLSSLYSQFDPIDPDGTSRAVRERLRPILRLAQAARGVRQHRHGAARVQGRDAPDLPRGARRGRSSATGRTSASRSRRTCKRCGDDLRGAGRVGRAARDAGLGAAGEGGVLGLRDGRSRRRTTGRCRCSSRRRRRTRTTSGRPSF